MPNTDMIQRGIEAREQVNTEIVPALVKAFGSKVSLIAATGDQIPQVWAPADVLVEVVQWLRSCGFNMLVDLTAVDYYPNREPRFEMVYHFRQLPALGVIRVRVRCGEKAEVPTLSHLWSMADPAEREVFDQFGIRFKGHPNLKRILNPDDWEGHPLRRDYPTRGPRALISLEMPADENRYYDFPGEESSKDGK